MLILIWICGIWDCSLQMFVISTTQLHNCEVISVYNIVFMHFCHVLMLLIIINYMYVYFNFQRYLFV